MTRPPKGTDCQRSSTRILRFVRISNVAQADRLDFKRPKRHTESSLKGRDDTGTFPHRIFENVPGHVGGRVR